MDLKNKRLLITGANGFIGKRLVNYLQKKGAKVYLFSRLSLPMIEGNLVSLDRIAELEIDVVIHLAGRAHIGEESDLEAEHQFYSSNVELSVNIANESAKAGAKRFIFISSIGVLGISSLEPFVSSSAAAPSDLYSISKFKAELKLQNWSSSSCRELVIIRPPLVYGREAPGNFGKLTKLVHKNLPLPLGAIHNKRSFVALDNLVDLIVTCIDHPGAANQTFLVSDDRDVSTTELLQMMTRAAGKKPRLIPVPVSWLRFAARLTGKQAVIERLCGNLQVDITHTKDTLGWKPPISIEEGIARCFKDGD